MKKLFTVFSVLTVLLLLISGCNGTENHDITEPLTFPDEYLSEQAEKDGCFIDNNGKIFNKEAITDFIDKTNAKTEAAVTCVYYTQEQYPVFTQLIYTGGIFTVYYDSTRDKTGVQEEYSETYEYLNILELSTQTWIILSNNKDLTATEYEHMILSSDTADWIPHFFVCAIKE